MTDTAAVVVVRAGQATDAPFVEATLTARWGADGQVAGHGVLYNALDLPCYVAEIDGQPVGVATFHDDGDEREVVTIDAVRRGAGVGGALLRAIEQDARLDGIRRLWLVTTNDNIPALRSYQRAGWDLVAVHRNAVDNARRLKPTIPLTGNDGIPIRHELELERLLR